MTVQARKPAGIAAIMGLAALAVLLLSAVTAPKAAAATCDKTWAGGGSGLWLSTGNWIDGDADPNNNVPGLGDNACIIAAGTYTVTIVDNGIFGGGSAKSITVGDGNTANGTVTLAVASSTSNSNTPLDGTLNGLSEPSTIATDGVVDMTSVGANPGQANLLASSTINNAGVLRSSAGAGGGRLFNIDLANAGTVDIAYNAAQGFTRTWTNNGTFNVANGQTFTIVGSGGGPTFNQAGGTLHTNATGTFFSNGGFFTHTGGATAGTKAIQLCGPQLSAPSGGTGNYDFVRVPANGCGGGTISGPIGSAKTVRLNNDSNNAMGVSLTGDLANNGTLILDGSSEDQLLGGFTLTNNAILRTAGTGGRLFGINLTNSATGSVQVNQDAVQGFTSTWSNSGSFNVADGERFTLTGNGGGPTFNQLAGTLTTNASGTFYQDSGTFNHTGGSQSGSPVQLCGPKLNAPTGGAGSYVFLRIPAGFCGGGQIGDNIGAGKTVRLFNDSNGAMGVSLAAPLANNGTLILDGPAEDQLLGFTTLTNNGTFQITGSGARLIGDNVTNSATGTIDVDQDVNFGFTPTFTNNGAIDVAAGKTMSLTGSGGGPVYNQSGGTVNVAGTLNHGGGAYNHSGGTTTVASGGQIVTNNNSIAMSGGTIRGGGTVNVGSQTLNNTGGTVHPGSSPGILTITGNYSQGAGGSLAVDIAGVAPGTGYSRLAVNGGASLGGELDITNAISSAPGQAFQVLTAGNVGGTFATLDVHGGLPNYNAQYNATNVTLVARGPAAPNVTGTTPASGSDDNAPKVVGSAQAGSTVSIYTTADCSGAPVATGSAADLASGITVNVADNSTTTFRANASNADGTSACSSSSVTYTETSVSGAKPGAVKFAKGPAKKTTKKKAKFTFSASDAASYECKLDKAAFAPCTSPAKVKKLKPGKHKFSVRAIGAAGDAGATTTFKWKVKRKKK